LAKGVVEEKYIDSLDLGLLDHQEMKYLSKHFAYFSDDFDVVGHCKEWIDKHGIDLPKPKDKSSRKLGEDTRKNASKFGELEMLEKIEVDQPTTPRKVREAMDRKEELEEREEDEFGDISLKNRKKKKKSKK
jgi:hypothetical protein